LLAGKSYAVSLKSMGDGVSGSKLALEVKSSMLVLTNKAEASPTGLRGGSAGGGQQHSTYPYSDLSNRNYVKIHQKGFIVTLGVGLDIVFKASQQDSAAICQV
jgi:hypothetical protein